MLKKLEMINKILFDVELMSFTVDSKTGDIEFEIFNGEENLDKTTKLKLSGVWVVSYTKTPYLDLNNLIPYGMTLMKVEILSGENLLNLIKKINHHFDYSKGGDNNNNTQEELEKIGFEKYGPKHMIYLSTKEGIIGDFLCHQISLIDFNQQKINEINIDLN